MLTEKPIIMIGSGGHAFVLLDILLHQACKLMGYVAPKEEYANDLIYLGDDSFLEDKKLVDSVYLVNGLGSIHIPYLRRNIFLKFKQLGYHFLSIIHPAAVISKQTEIKEGAQIMANCVIQPGCVIGENSIINTMASIDHHSIVSAHSHIAPGATICGNVVIGETSHIGPKSTILQNSLIMAESFVRANSLVHNNEVNKNV